MSIVTLRESQKHMMRKANISSLKHIFSNSGISLVEVIVAINIIAVIFFAAAFASASSLRAAKESQNRILATRYAEELEEWMRGEKENDWSTFEDRSSAAPGTTYCFSSTTLSWPTSGTCGSSFALGSKFKREAKLVDGGTYVEVEISTYWNNGQLESVVPIDTIFSPWD